MPLLNQSQMADDGHSWILQDRLTGPLFVVFDEVLGLAIYVTWSGTWV